MIPVLGMEGRLMKSVMQMRGIMPVLGIERRWVKSAVLFIALIMLAGFASADRVGLAHAGDVSITMEKAVYKPGEVVKAEIVLSNADSTPVIGGYVVVELVQGKEYYYPSQNSDADNVFYEEKISGLNIEAGKRKTIEFSYTLPKNIKPGEYRMDVYFKTELAYIIGIPHIFVSPRSVGFEVEGTGGNFPEVSILRTKTVFADTAGPVGPPVSAGSEVKGKVYVKNSSPSAAGGLKLNVSVCEWDDTACKSFDVEQAYDVGNLGAGEEKAIDVSFTAPLKPSAHAIRLEVVDGKGEMVSLYRNRIIVTGATAKVRKLEINDISFSKGENVVVDLIIGPSPDHYNNPVFRDFDVALSVRDLEERQVTYGFDPRQIKIYSNTARIPEISVTAGVEGFIKKSYAFSAESELRYIEICAEISKGNEREDYYCIEVKAEDFGAVTGEARIDVSWNYDYDRQVLGVEFCEYSDGNALSAINADYVLVDIEDFRLLSMGRIDSEECGAKEFSAKPGKYLITATDIITNAMADVEIEIAGEEIVPAHFICSGGEVVGSKEECPDKPADEGQKEEAGAVEANLEAVGNSLLVVYAVIAIVIVAIAAIAVRRRIHGI